MRKSMFLMAMTLFVSVACTSSKMVQKTVDDVFEQFSNVDGVVYQSVDGMASLIPMALTDEMLDSLVGSEMMDSLFNDEIWKDQPDATPEDKERTLNMAITTAKLMFQTNNANILMLVNEVSDSVRKEFHEALSQLDLSGYKAMELDTDNSEIKEVTKHVYGIEEAGKLVEILLIGELDGQETGLMQLKGQFSKDKLDDMLMATYAITKQSIKKE